MIFIDGSWMYHNKQHIMEAFNTEDFDIDYATIPRIVEKRLNAQITSEAHVVRTYYFGSIPVNKPGFESGKQESFYKYLAQKCRFETEIYDIDFRNDSGSRPREKCVDIALAASMLYYAAIPGAYDIATLVAGDLDYMPVIQKVRLLGKRTQLVGIKNLDTYYPTSNKLLSESSLFDFPTIFLDEYLTEIRLQREQILRSCKNCMKKEFTTWTGKDFYCSKCRALNTKRIRICDTCGKEEETNWNKSFFYCADCRGEYRRARNNSPAEAE